MTTILSRFPIPVSLQDLEREPYNLQPYPHDFNDDNEAARADSFLGLVGELENQNQVLSNADMGLFSPRREDGENDWMDEDRMQSLYTLVRKSTSLAPSTRLDLAKALADSVHCLSNVLAVSETNAEGETAPQSFRDTFACHVYMLYSFMFLFESDNKGTQKLNELSLQIRQISSDAMVQAAEAMADFRRILWRRGVPDESVVLLPCRIAYPMLEIATGVIARKAACGDQALRMIAVTVDANESVLCSVTAALMDLMHSFEHMASLTAELCTKVSDEPMNRLAVELLREIGRLDCNDGKAVGIKNVAPFISDLASLRPRILLSNIPHILPHLNSEPYNLRSSIVLAISHILEFLFKLEEVGISHESNSTDKESDKLPPMLQKEKAVENLLDILVERAHDVSSYTRAATMKAWIRLVESRLIPKEKVITVTKLAMDRLQDKTVVVRKQAMQLLTCLLENNPFMGNLDPVPFVNKLQELYTFVKTNLPANIKEAYDESLLTGNHTSSDNLEEATLAAAISVADDWLIDESIHLSESQREYCYKIQALKFTQATLEFISVFEGATKALEGMLLSNTTSDVTEALRFFVKARHFKLPCAFSGMNRALALVWSTEQSIRDEVLNAFIDVCIAVPGSEGTKVLSDDDIALNLITLTGRATVSEIASIEEAVVQLVKGERIPPSVFNYLWSIVSKNNETRATAIQIVSMGAAADRTIIDSKCRLKLLLEKGLMECTRSDNNWKLASVVACCLQRLGRAVVDERDAKFVVLEHIVDELCKIVTGECCRDENTNDTLEWFSAAEQSIKALFVICPEPESICNSIVVSMSSSTFDRITNSCHSLRLARSFHVLGQISLNLLVYTESLIGSVRRAAAKRSLNKQEEADKAKSNKKHLKSNHMADDEDEMEAELGMAAAAEAENERKLVDISENEILGRGLISQYAPLLVLIIGNENGTFNSEILMQASILALCKFMCVSSTFCDKHLPLLFTALLNAPPGDMTMRANTVVALGDLAFRFPNEVEPYTPRIYACLRDPSTKVRRHTLMVLTHLILNDMIKVKGQVCEIALCLKDEDPRIRDMSRLLFHELSKRSNNPIYNLLPDIISQLGQLAISKEDFRNIMAFLLSYIKKERQFEMLTEKLCLRFPKCTTISQKADLAFCITQLKLNEKCIKCLSDNFKLYKDALFDEDVMKSFTGMVTKAKKHTKPEAREFIDEWEAKLSEFAAVGAENERANDNAENAKLKASKKLERMRKQRKNPLKNVENSMADISICDETDESLAKGTSMMKVRKSVRRTKETKNRVADENDTSSEEFEFDDEDSCSVCS